MSLLNHFRETNDATVLDRARVDIIGHFAGYETFQPTNVFVVTWDNVGRYDRQSDKVLFNKKIHVAY